MKEKKNTLDKFMVTRLNIKNSKNKVVTLPTGEQVTIPRLGYRHFTQIKAMKDPMQLLEYIIKEIQPRELTAAETEFLLIHLHYHNDDKAMDALKEIGINLDDMKISEAKYEHTFDNLRLVFNKPTLMLDDLALLLKEAYDNGKPIELTDETRIQLINCLYRYEYDDVKRGVLQEVYIVHEGKTIKGLNIIGE